MSTVRGPSPLRRWRTLVIAAVAVAAAVTVGFSTGWLALSDGHRPVGRLRPADLAVPGEASTTTVPPPTTTMTPRVSRPTTRASTATSQPDDSHGSSDGDGDDGDGDDDDD